MEDNNTNFYVLSALLSILLEEISTFQQDHCFTTNAFQFSKMKDLVLQSIDALNGDDNDWNFLLDGKSTNNSSDTQKGSKKTLFNFYLAYDTELKKEDFLFENLTDAFLYRYRMASSIFNTDWNKKNAPRHLLTREWLRLSPNAFSDGCLMNEYISLREGGPTLTNDLTKIPKNKLDRLTLFQLLKSRIIRCEYNIYCKNFNHFEVE